MYQFLTDEHEARFNELCRRDKTYFNDSERRSLFFAISGNDALYHNVERIYDFEDKVIRLEIYDEAFLTSGIRGLIELAFALYGYGACDVRQLFNSLDYVNSVLAIEAIKSRFQVLDYPGCKVL